MTKSFCDICSEEMNEDVFRSRRYGDGVNDPMGYFAVNYYRAVKGKDGNVHHYQYDPNFVICTKCRNKANAAIWEALMPSIKGREDRKEIELNSFDPIVSNG